MRPMIRRPRCRSGRSEPSRRQTALACAMLVILFAVILRPDSAVAQATGQDTGSYIGSFGNWEGHLYRIDVGETRCAIRALHPAILDAEIYWIFNTRLLDRLPDGFLAIDRRIADGAAEIAVIVDGEDRFALRIGDDGYGYSLRTDAVRLIAAMRRGIEMEVIVSRRTTGRQVLPVSLLGFTRGSNAARRACAN